MATTDSITRGRGSARVAHRADSAVTPSAAVLVEQIAARDQRAFEQLYDRFAGIGFSVAVAIVGKGRNAEDVVQEAFLSIWKNSASFDSSRGSVRAWFIGTVRHRAIDALRYHGRRPSLDHDDESALAASADEGNAKLDPVRTLADGELRGAVAELPREQREVIVLAYFGGYSHREIAEATLLPLGTVKGRIRLALERLRRSAHLDG